MNLFNKGVEDADVADLRNSNIENPEDSGEELSNTGENTAGVADLQADGENAEVAAPEEMSDQEFDRYISNIMTGDNSAPVVDEADGGDDNHGGADNTDNEKKELQDEPFKTFNSEDEYQAEIDRIFNKRHRDYKDVVAERDSLVEQLKEFYNVEDAKEAIELFGNQLRAQKAADQGMSEEEYEQDRINKMKIRAFDAQVEKEKTVNEARGKLFAEAYHIRESDKNFDLQKAYNEDAEFKKDLENTGSVYFAYSKLIQRNASKGAAPVPKQKRTFVEEGAMPSRKGQVTTSAANLSDEDFDQYIRNILGEG